MTNGKLDTESRGFHVLAKHLKSNHNKEMTRMNTIIDDMDNEMIDLEDQHNKEVHQLQS